MLVLLLSLLIIFLCAIQKEKDICVRRASASVSASHMAERASIQLIKAHNQVCSSPEPALWIYDVPGRRLSHANDLPTAYGPLRTHILFYSRYRDVMSW